MSERNPKLASPLFVSPTIADDVATEPGVVAPAVPLRRQRFNRERLQLIQERKLTKREQPLVDSGGLIPLDLNQNPTHCSDPRLKFRPMSRNFNRHAKAMRSYVSANYWPLRKIKEIIWLDILCPDLRI